MAQYRVLERSFIGDRLVEAGEIVDYDGTPGRNLVALEAATEEPKKGKRTAPAASEPKSEDEGSELA